MSKLAINGGSPIRTEGYPQWPVWDKIVGIADRNLQSYRHDEVLKICVADSAHPITQDLSDWSMVDETYQMADAVGQNHILLKVDHRQSMETIAWTHRYRNSKVFCLQSGHDNQTWINENFRTVLQRGIEWCSKRQSD